MSSARRCLFCLYLATAFAARVAAARDDSALRVFVPACREDGAAVDRSQLLALAAIELAPRSIVQLERPGADAIRIELA